MFGLHAGLVRSAEAAAFRLALFFSHAKRLTATATQSRRLMPGRGPDMWDGMPVRIAAAVARHITGTPGAARLDGSRPGVVRTEPRRRGEA